MKRLFLLLLLISSVPFSYSQEIEKLQKELKDNPQTRLQTAAKLRDLFSDLSSDSSYVLGNYILKQGIEDDSQPLMMFGKLILGAYYNTAGKTEISIKYLNECLDYYTKKGDYEKIADAQNQLGIAFIYNSEYNKAAKWFIKSLRTSEKLGPGNESYMGQLNLSEVYIREGKLDLAEAEVLSFIEKVKKQKLMRGLKKGYDYLAKIYMHKGDMPLAIEYYQKALELALKNSSKRGKANAYNNIAIAHFETGELELSLENFRKALQLRLELNQPLGISESYYNLGDWNFYQDKFDDAIHYYMISLDIAKKNNLTKEMSDAFNMIAESYKAKGNYKEAYNYLEKHLEQVDIMREKNQVREIDLQRATYEAEREEQHLKQKKREELIQNRVETEQDRGKIIVIGFSLVVGLLIISYFFLLAKNHRSASKILVTETVAVVDEHYKVQESKWNKIEHFISRTENSGPEELDLPGFENAVTYIENIGVLPLEEGLFFWEAPVSKLENYIFRDYLGKKIVPGTKAVHLIEALKQQKLVDNEILTYGVISRQNKEISISGKNGLLIQSKDKMSFLTENPANLKTFTILISEHFKNELVTSSEWERFMDQIEIIQKMSPRMAIKTIRECWSETLKSEKLGMILLFPE